MWALWVTLLCYIGGAGLARLYVPQIYKKLIDLLTHTTVPVFAQSEVFALLEILLITFITFNILFRIADYANSYFQSATMKNLYDDAYRRVQAHSFDFFSNTFSGSLVAKTKRYVNAFEDIFDRIFYDFLFTTVIVVGAITILYFQAPQVAAVITIGVILFVAVVIYFNSTGQYLREKEAQCDSTTTGTYADIVSNAVVVKSYTAEELEEKNFAQVTDRQHKARLAMWNFDNARIMILGAIFMFMELGGMYMAVRLWIAGTISAGTVVLVQIYFGNIFYNIWNLGRAIQRFNKSIADSKEMLEIFERPYDIADVMEPQPSRITHGAVVFDAVSFSYPNGSDVFENFNLAVTQGSRVGIVGHSGAGKTTITKLLLRFYDVDEGIVSIGGQDIRSITQADLREKISYVPQEPLLFHRSIKDNIAYGLANPTLEDIQDVAKKAQAHDFIVKLPQGYDTLVGERGVKLSGGERQRVAIARAMLKQAPILLLDEATSSLDSVSETYIQKALDELMKEKTVIVIAHRLSTIQKMDRIIVLDQGKIVEDGAHADLLAKHGVYYELWTHQSAGFIAE